MTSIGTKALKAPTLMRPCRTSTTKVLTGISSRTPQILRVRSGRLSSEQVTRPWLWVLSWVPVALSVLVRSCRTENAVWLCCLLLMLRTGVVLTS